MKISKAEVRFLRSLSQRKFRDEHGKFILEGWRPLKDALNAGVRIDFVAMTKTYFENPDYRSIIQEIEQRKLPLKEMSDAELKNVSETVHAQGVLALVNQQHTRVDDLGNLQRALVVVADRIADPGNMGSIIRTCDWFGVDALILSEGCVDIYNEKVVRSTAGSILHVRCADHVPIEDALTALRNNGFLIVGTAGEAKTSYRQAQYRNKTAVVVGSESEGLGPSARGLCDEIVKIDRHGRAESLNVVVACGIILSHIRLSH